MERKVWARAYAEAMYPNIFAILVGPAGVGKTVITSRVDRLWQELMEDGHYVASSSLTAASLLDDLHEAERRIVRPTENPPVETFNSLKICSNELSSLIPGYDTEFMAMLTDIYDCRRFSQRRRTRNLNIQIDQPQLNLLAGTTPSYLNSVLPEGAWDQGFLSRTILIYSGEIVKRPLFKEENYNQELWDALASDLRKIGNLYGKAEFTPEAAKCLEDWDLEGGPPAPEHPKLTTYSTRRTAQTLKLCMVSSVSRSDDLTITLDDVQQAMDWLIEAEHYMPDIFKSMSSGGDSRAIEDTWYHVYQLWMKEKEPIAERRVVQFLQERVPAHSVQRVLDVMQKAGAIEKQLNGYVPKVPGKS